MDKKVPLKIDGKDVEATAGQTILECARDNGIFIPTLCHYAKTTNVGACRVCVVEQEGARSLVAACCMPVSPNMVIRTNSEPVNDYRIVVAESCLLVEDRPAPF
jgi:NADH dehydrogenase/NADH:ubiquinone oxidoreductase subunit G